MTLHGDQLKDELESIQGIGGVELANPGLLRLTDFQALVILSPDNLRGQFYPQVLSKYGSEDFDHVLVILDEYIVDIAVSPVLIYTDDNAIGDSEAVASYLQAILDGRRSPIELDVIDENIMRRLQEIKMLSYPTPSSAAELLVNWSTVGGRQKILNAGCGTGELLVKTRDALSDQDGEYTGDSLWGVDINQISKEITKHRVGEDATVLSADFLRFDDSQLGNFGDYRSSLGDDVSIPVFDAVISQPPVVRRSDLTDSVREILQNKFNSTLDQAFVLHSLSLLKDEGRGAFLLPQSSLTEDFMESLQSKARIHCLAYLNNAEVLTLGFEPVLLFIEKNNSETDTGDSIRLLNIESEEITERHKALLYGPIYETVDRANGFDDVSMTTVSPSEVKYNLLPLALKAPEATPFLFSEAFEGLTSVAKPKTGLSTGANSFFYFNTEEKDESNIPEDLFTPVLRKLSPQTHRVTEEDLNWYLLDLQDIIDKGHEELDNSDEFFDWLVEQGYSSLVDYIPKNHDLAHINLEDLDTLIPKGYNGRVRNPDLVAQRIFSRENASEPEWWLVDIDDEVVFDTTMVGIHCHDGTPPLALWGILNSPLYRRIQKDSMPSLHSDPNYGHFRIRELRSLPIIDSCLRDSFAHEIEALLPIESAPAEVTVRNLFIETCSPEERPAVNAAFEAFSQQALTWLLSKEELDKLRDLIEENTDPEQFLLEHFEDEPLDHIQQMFLRANFFDERRDIILDLIELFDQKRYQTFLVGLASQFEGVLVDYLEDTGGHIGSEIREVEFDGEKTEIEVIVFYRPGQEGKKKDLKRLFDEFFEGEYLKFLQKTVREPRNDLAHGKMVENPDETAVLLLISFVGMTNNILHRYNRYLAQAEG